ncbi:hypothetical protein DFH28DRAFT_936260 [Melampsora americana]|nr:hypothetical protein DFH28DRAFT_936260 [Melampsora americana]
MKRKTEQQIYVPLDTIPYPYIETKHTPSYQQFEYIEVKVYSQILPDDQTWQKMSQALRSSHAQAWTFWQQHLAPLPTTTKHQLCVTTKDHFLNYYGLTAMEGFCDTLSTITISITLAICFAVLTRFWLLPTSKMLLSEARAFRQTFKD